MAKVVDRYQADRETLIKFVRDSAEYIKDNAEDLVGNNRKMTGLDIKISVDVESLPQVTLERRYITVNWAQEKLVRYGEEYDNQGTTNDDRVDEGDISVQG